jgi:hypothetical protein
LAQLHVKFEFSFPGIKEPESFDFRNLSGGPEETNPVLVLPPFLSSSRWTYSGSLLAPPMLLCAVDSYPPPCSSLLSYLFSIFKKGVFGLKVMGLPGWSSTGGTIFFMGEYLEMLLSIFGKHSRINRPEVYLPI